MRSIYIPIIAKYGTEFAYKLWGNASTDSEPTEAEWQELLALAEKNYDDYIAEAKARAVIPPPTQ